MKSVADELRAEARADVARRAAGERVELALRLGDDDLTLLCAARGISPEEARRVFAASRAVGRGPSVANDGGD